MGNRIEPTENFVEALQREKRRGTWTNLDMSGGKGTRGQRRKTEVVAIVERSFMLAFGLLRQLCGCSTGPHIKVLAFEKGVLSESGTIINSR
jgi:hypothetical protein